MPKPSVALRAWWFVCALALLGSCGVGDEHIDITFDPCEPLVVRAHGASAAELESIVAAADMWNGSGTKIRVLVPDEITDPPVDAEVAIRFERGAPVFHGIYRDEVGDVVINRSVTDTDERAIVVAHELGHAFGLQHRSAGTSLMSPGNLETPLRPADVAALSARWPDCPSLAD